MPRGSTRRLGILGADEIDMAATPVLDMERRGRSSKTITLKKTWRMACRVVVHLNVGHGRSPLVDFG